MKPSERIEEIGNRLVAKFKFDSMSQGEIADMKASAIIEFLDEEYEKKIDFLKSVQVPGKIEIVKPSMEKEFSYNAGWNDALVKVGEIVAALEGLKKL